MKYLNLLAVSILILFLAFLACQKKTTAPINHPPTIEWATPESPVNTKPGKKVNLEALINDQDNDKLTATWKTGNTTKTEQETPPYPARIKYEIKRLAQNTKVSNGWGQNKTMELGKSLISKISTLTCHRF